MNDYTDNAKPAFYTVTETARILRVGASTLYRAIREGAFPAVRLRSRYVVPATARDKLLAEVAETGGLVDPARMAAAHRTAREVERLTGGCVVVSRDDFLEQLAVALDRYADVPDDMLWEIVTREGGCMWLYATRGRRTGPPRSHRS